MSDIEAKPELSRPDRPESFDDPTRLPADEGERSEWQNANRSWWEATPMRYDWREAIPFEAGTKEYFDEVDRRFFVSAREFLPWRTKPFDALIPFQKLPELDVLEIGVGHGSHAMLLASSAKSFTGIDLTEAAVTMTRKRFDVHNVPGRIERMDAENMSFSDDSFDYIWSWGVIHHSADTQRIVGEMHRVLRPDGIATIMVYYRGWWNYYIVSGILFRLRAWIASLTDKSKKSTSLHNIAQDATDGAIARYYNPKDLAALCKDRFVVENVFTLGQKPDILPLPAGRFKNMLLRLIPNALARVLLRHFRMGTFLVAQLRKV